MGRGVVPDGGETGKDSEPFEFSFGAISWDKALNGAGDEYECRGASMWPGRQTCQIAPSNRLAATHHPKKVAGATHLI